MADQTLVERSALDKIRQQPATTSVERINPGETENDLYLEHLGRYQFASTFVEDKSVLDAACGVGYGAPLLCAAGARKYIGIDINAEAIRTASSRFRSSEKASFLVGEACELDEIEDVSVEVAISFETIEHLNDPPRFLQNLRRAIVPGGTLIISTPNRTISNPGASLDARPVNPFHVREWNVPEFIKFVGDFFVVDKVLGQLPCPYWRALGHEVFGHRMLRPVKAAYKAAKGSLLGNEVPAPGYEGPVRVEPMGRWQVPTYIVCVCKRPRLISPLMVGG